MGVISFMCPLCGGKNEYSSERPHDVPFVPQLDDGRSSTVTLSLFDSVIIDKRMIVCKHCLASLTFDATLPTCCDVVVKPFRILLRVEGVRDETE